jgi:hypothetical protein
MPLVKGTILVRGDNGWIALSPGSDNQELVYDSTQQSGVKWQNKQKSYKVVPQTTGTVSSSTYTTVASFSYPGSSSSAIDSVTVISYMDSGITSYDIRLFDATNSLEICTGNFSNTSEQINNLGTISNVPSGDAILELQARRNGGSGNKNATIEDFTVNYR